MAATIVRRLTVAKKHYSIRSIAKEFQLNEKSIRTFLEKKGIRCYKKQKRNLIPANQQEKRKICCGRLRRRFRETDIPNFLFVDECYVTVQKCFNHQHERCYGKFFEVIPRRKKFKEIPKTPLSAMIFGGVSREGRTPLVVLPSGFRLNQQTYQEKCIRFVQKNMPYKLNAKTAIFYQDKAPCHAGKSTQDILAEIFPCFIRNNNMPPMHLI